MFAPDVVEESGTYILLVGSGDREKPLRGDFYPNAYGVTNYFFMVKDKPADPTWLSSESTNCGGQSLICLESLYGILTNSTPEQSLIDAKKGWYLGMADHEQIVTSAITLFGTVTFSTHIPVVPAANACSSTLGTANVYNISYLNAASTGGDATRFDGVTGGGLSPSPVAGFVTIYEGTDPLDYDGTNAVANPTGTLVPFCIGCGKESLEGGEKTGGSSALLSQPKGRVYWYIQQ
jgi:type IV pilus assembly protein PilY1